MDLQALNQTDAVLNGPNLISLVNQGLPTPTEPSNNSTDPSSPSSSASKTVDVPSPSSSSTDALRQLEEKLILNTIKQKSDLLGIIQGYAKKSEEMKNQWNDILGKHDNEKNKESTENASSAWVE